MRGIKLHLSYLCTELGNIPLLLQILIMIVYLLLPYLVGCFLTFLLSVIAQVLVFIVLLVLALVLVLDHVPIVFASALMIGILVVGLLCPLIESQFRLVLEL